ncbi:MAG: alpha/beta hydrolase [Magnetospirillum sp.]|nr:alpha/beta hydrolase [Magnetospirillum sp.]
MVSLEILARTNDFKQRVKLAISGHGRQTVVLANGFGTDQTMWHRVLPWLEERYRVVRFDWVIDPRHYDASRYSRIDGFVDDLLAVLMAAETSHCLYVGHSMGGMIGMLAAKRAPEKFRAMVMLAPSPCYVNHPGYGGGFDPDDIEALLSSIGTNYLDWVRSFSPVAVAGSADGEEVAEFTRSLLAMRPDVAFAMALTIFKLDLRDQLDGFTTPTTIVQTLEDVAVPMEVAGYLHDKWPQSRLEIIDASGHFPHMTAPSQLIAILEGALPKC